MTGALMGYAPVDTSVPNMNRAPLVDHLYGRVFAWDTLTPGVRWFDSYPNGNETVVRTAANMGVVGLFGPWTLCSRSQYIACVEDSTNGSRILFLDRSNFAVLGSFGTSDSSFTNSATHIERPNCMVSIVGGTAALGSDILICNSIRTDKVLNAVTVGGLATQLGTIDENQCVLGAIPDGSGTVAYALGYNNTGAATQIGLYKLTPTIVPIAKILPASIDPAWAHIDNVYGITVDQTDGQLIVGIANVTDVVTHPAYLVKLNATTGAVMWTVAVGTIVNYDPQDSMKQNLVTKGTLYYLAITSNTLYTINTLTGAAVTSTLDHAVVGPLNGSQLSEDVTGSLYWRGSWAEGTTHPAYLGTYCLVQGNHSGTGLIWRYFPNGQPLPAPVYAIAAQSRRRAWTFTLDGHVFYVLDLGAEGTYLYDKTTGNWCKWITSGFLGWDVVNGAMWQRDRIVGGDYISGALWEMQPAATMDCDSTLAITHVVTGGLVKRSRVYVSLEAINMAVSSGQLDATGSTVLLEMSDDQGKTWVAADPVYTLTEGDYSAELAWRSLGAFAGPGRLFRVTDVGGFLRIDGMDAQIDDFDNDTPQQQGG